MSYAAVVAKGGPQDPQDAYVAPICSSAAPPVETVIPTDSSVASLIDVDSGVSVVSSDFQDQPVKTYTQAERLELEAQVAAEEEAARVRAAKRKSKVQNAGGDLLAWFKDPVHSGGAFASTALLVTLGVFGYKKYKVGEFSWKTAGIGASVLVGFSLVEFYATKFAQNYLKKKQN
ncbi:hypothetical protein H072_9830 [Dactylellina haptotyla CBS 200.50]|uniref:Uncharacterized protein n=1 Tax=Dactylellina haptotyla (strain CBS 200.50) TaxID=1284197 RepID=S8A680_DACHA|nr:hypothetical protein H072_9830 [Dactylellina haptotyla CBS 200.50]